MVRFMDDKKIESIENSVRGIENSLTELESQLTLHEHFLITFLEYLLLKEKDTDIKRFLRIKIRHFQEYDTVDNGNINYHNPDPDYTEFDK